MSSPHGPAPVTSHSRPTGAHLRHAYGAHLRHAYGAHLRAGTLDARRRRPPMTVSLVTGAGGFVGTRLRRHLAARNEEVRVQSALDSGEDEIAAALGGVERLYFLAGVAHEAAAGGDLDVMHRVNVEAPLRWLQAADRAAVPRFVWLSSIKVLGDESTRPLRVEDDYRPGDPYARTKVEAEQRLLQVPLRNTRLVVVRPPLVYGPGVRANFQALLRLADSSLPLPFGRATAPRSMVAVDNLCDLLVRLGDAGSGVYHVADAADFTVAGLLDELRRLLGRAPRQLPVPAAAMRMVMTMAGRRDAYARLFEPLQVDQSATRAELGWTPPQPSARALEETVTWFRTLR